MRDAERFWRNERIRGARCVEKDALTRRLMEPLDPGPDFAAILMPCLYGVEMDVLEAKGVGKDRMFAIEREPDNWRDMKRIGRVTLTDRPMDADEAVDHLWAMHPEGFDFVYFDFLSQPGFVHKTLFRKVFELGMLKAGARMILTFGLNRCRPSVKALNSALGAVGVARQLPTKQYVHMALEESGHPPPSKILSHEYTSTVRNVLHHYEATEVIFDGTARP